MVRYGIPSSYLIITFSVVIQGTFLLISKPFTCIIWIAFYNVCYDEYWFFPLYLSKCLCWKWNTNNLIFLFNSTNQKWKKKIFRFYINHWLGAKRMRFGGQQILLTKISNTFNLSFSCWTNNILVAHLPVQKC